MQEQNRLKAAEEQRKAEEKISKQQRLRERAVNECRSVTKKQAAPGPGDPEEQLLKARTFNFEPDVEDEVGIEKARADRHRLVEDNQRKFQIAMDDDDDDSEEQQKKFKIKTKKGIRFGSKTAANMKELSYGVGQNKLVGFTDPRYLPQTKNQLPSMTSKKSNKIRLLPVERLKQESSPDKQKKFADLKKEDRNTSTQKVKRLDPMLNNSIIKEDYERREKPTMSLSIVRKNIENIGKLPRNLAYITTVYDWLKKHRRDPGTKVFIVSSAYPDIKEALEERGWIENTDYDSPCYHLKFSLKCKDIDYNQLEPYQLVNHFEKATNITTKSGLCKSIKNMVWSCHQDPDSCFPKCFDTADDGEFEAFVSYYKSIKAEGVLKEFLAKPQDQQVQMLTERKSQIEAAVKVLMKRLMDLDSIVDQPGVWTEVTNAEWNAIGFEEKKFDKDREASIEGPVRGKKVERLDRSQVTRTKKEMSLVNKSIQLRSRSIEINHMPDLENEDEVEEEAKIPLDLNNHATTLKKVTDLIKKISEKFPQTSINGLKNIWIVKPAGLSRGRGIKLCDNLSEIYNCTKGKDSNWVIQKYIEHPLLFKGRKLDIRQWVMVTDWNPLMVWFYQECYIRLSTNEYDLSDISNKFSHLTNNSINKYAKDFEKEAGFLSQDDFAEYLKTLNYEGYTDPFYEKIQPRMKEIVKYSLMCVQDMVENRKNSSEIYGYDFCIDDQLNPWLIEINASPAWDYSSVTWLNSSL